MYPQFTIHRDGWPFIAAFAVVSAILMAIFEPLGWLGFLLTAWCVYFFRDPVRVTPIGDDIAVSPADGMVSMIVDMEAPAETGLSGTYTRISIFLNVFDVHINRWPMDGLLTRKFYVPGKFVNASLDKASVDNERLVQTGRAQNGDDFAVVQIAGLVARRIVNWVHENQTLKAGERYGLIRFGSRVDLYLPPSYVPSVCVGQRVVGGETIVAERRVGEARKGEIR